MNILLAIENFGICAPPASSISRGRMASPITTYPSHKHRGRLGRFHIRSKFDTSSASGKSVIFICDGYNTANSEKGFALVAAMLVLSVLTALLGAYMLTSKIELGTTKAARDSQSGFNAAEAGLNIRAEQIRTTFLGYNRPSGTSPSAASACSSGNMGGGEFACQSVELGQHEATTYVSEDASNPIITTIPPGERYQNLNAQEYRYTVSSVGTSLSGGTEAILELRFKSRLVPMFQFVAFYNKDLEILPGQTMSLTGPVHTNGDLYLETGNNLDISGQLTAVGNLYHGRKNANTCTNQVIRVIDPQALRRIPTCNNRTLINNSQLVPWNGMIESHVEAVTVPEPETLDPTPGQVYWDLADLRLVLHLNNSNVPDTTHSALAVEVRDADDSVNTSKTTALAGCAGNISGRAVNNTLSFKNHREGANFIRMLEVDMVSLFNCIRTQNILESGRTLSDNTEGGLVFHFSVAGPNSASANSRYGVRLRGGSQLQSNISGAPTVRGLTVVTDQAAYIQGSYNSVGWIPAAVLSDSLNILSNSWADASSLNANCDTRVASDTAVYTALLSGTDTTGGVDGSGGQGGAYNGGLENYPRLHETWSSRTLTYKGSFVSLNRPRHVTGAWVYGSPQYQAPTRNWSYETRFNDAANLPPPQPEIRLLEARVVCPQV